MKVQSSSQILIRLECQEKASSLIYKLVRMNHMIFKVSFTSNILKSMFYFTNEFQSQKPAKAQKYEINMGKFWHHIYKNAKNKCISSFTFQHFNTDGFRKGGKNYLFFHSRL